MKTELPNKAELEDIRNLQSRWLQLNTILTKQFGKKLGMEGILFLIGLRELGAQPREFTKEEKRDMMHIALCAILAPAGYYRLSHLDQEGWPHWEEAIPLPFQDVFSQELFLKSHIVDYFADIYSI